MRIITTGGRRFDEPAIIDEALSPYLIEHGPHGLLIVEGGAKGADELVRRWCRKHRVPYATFEADWARHGKAAGPARNAAMLAVIQPDLVVVFPGGRGTADMARRAREAKVRVQIVLGPPLPPRPPVVRVYEQER